MVIPRFNETTSAAQRYSADCVALTETQLMR